MWSLHNGTNDVREDPSDEEVPEQEVELPMEPDNMQLIAAASLESTRVIAQIPACVVIKEVDIVMC